MKYKYKFKEIEGFENGLIIDLPKEIKTVSAFLTEIKDKEIGEWYIEGIDLVIKDKSEYEERFGECYGVKIKKAMTHVLSSFQDCGIADNCYIETEELKNLILVWMEELNKYKEKKEIEYNKKLNVFIEKVIKPNEDFRNALLKLINKLLGLRFSKARTIQKKNYTITVCSYTVHIRDSSCEDNNINDFNISPQDLKEIIIKTNEQKEKGIDLIY